MGEFAAGAVAAVTAGEEVVSASEPLRLLWAGTEGGMEQALVARAGIAFEGISSGQLRVTDPLKILRSLGKMSAGFRQSLALLDRFRPDVCFVTGGYVCGPVAAACSLRKVPILIYLPDVTPGFAIRTLSKLARRVAVTLPEVAQHFGGEAPHGKAVVTGYPVRQELVEAAADRRGARQELAAALGWPEGEGVRTGVRTGEDDLPLVLVWGGSQGARAINRGTWASVAQWLPAAAVLHVVGERDWPLYAEWTRTNPLPEALKGRYKAVAYLHETMPLALAAADLTVARAGASTLGEFPVAKLPAILAPYAGVNQMDNAQALVRRGAAVIVLDEELEEKLAPAVLDLLGNRERLAAMGEAMGQLARPHAAAAIAGEIIQLGRAS